ncbi:GNAT family N-acetyltransferase [Lacticaseibacillus camelliae]|uniref:Acetyltransferasegnat family n=1 Tax=Lacticaseibacillus camelliae DSM 22697 = JCM 13995 TaxID=1423730 RepID=A0A0R2EXQ7_9LACO|nr:GNAT family N-acetyltransferase [Lacticaseibacillus camelliae]KRN21224.1 acetyltransferasegnat family [Lacticaseibacillus camelliae DSM 22697 = JCM 13995]
MMQITQTPTLTKAQTAAAKALIKATQAVDGTHRDPYLENDLNFDQTMPAFFLAEAVGQPIGLLTLYADDAPGPGGVVDVSIHVLPEYRRQGVATALWQAARKVLQTAGYQKCEYATEAAFLTSHPQFLEQTQLVKDPASEIGLIAPAGSGKATDDVLTVAPLTSSDIETLLPLYMEAFADESGTDEDQARRYLEVARTDPAVASFVCHYQGQPIGYCAVDLDDYDYFYGLFIAKDYRNQGVGSRFIQLMMGQLSATRHKDFRLDVDSDNLAAYHVYRKAGFKPLTESFYLSAPTGRWALRD